MLWLVRSLLAQPKRSRLTIVTALPGHKTMKFYQNNWFDVIILGSGLSDLFQLLTDLLQQPELKLDTQELLKYLVDSLMALEITRRTKLDLGIRIPMVKLFEDDCIEEPIDFMLNRLVLTSVTKSTFSASNRGNDFVEIVL